MAAIEPVLTVTLNPAIDVDYVVPGLRRGMEVRSTGGLRRAGGKGLNISQALGQMQVASAAAFVAGGADAEVLMSLLEEASFKRIRVPIANPVRTNIRLVGREQGALVKVNQRGPRIEAGEADLILSKLARAARGRRWVALAGSLPPGMPADFYARLTRAAHGAGARVAIDAAGEPLRLALGEKPELIRLNRAELQETLQTRRLGSAGRVRAGMSLLAEEAGGMIVVSDAARTTHALAEGEFWQIDPPQAHKGRGFQGAGDAMLAGLIAGLLMEDAPFEHVLVLGMSCAASWVEQEFEMNRRMTADASGS